MIALIDNVPGGTVRITLYQDKDRFIAEETKYELELKYVPERAEIFILEAASLADMLKTHGNWFDKVEGK